MPLVRVSTRGLITIIAFAFDACLSHLCIICSGSSLVSGEERSRHDLLRRFHELSAIGIDPVIRNVPSSVRLLAGRPPFQRLCTPFSSLQYRSTLSRMCAAPVLEGTNYPSLTSGHPESSCTDILIVGLHVKVYGLDEIKGSKLPIAAVVSS